MPHDVSSTRIVLLGTEADNGTLTGVTTGKSQPVDCRGFTAMTLYFIGTGTITGGVVKVEEADSPAIRHTYSGTWDETASVNASSVTANAQATYHFTAGQCRSVMRVRISSTVTGTVPKLSVVLVAQ